MTAGSRPVTVRFTATGLQFSTGDAGTELIVWPFSRLEAAVPISHDSGDVLLKLLPERDATLFVASPEFVSRLVAHAPRLGTGSTRWQAARPWVYIASVMVAVIFGLWVADVKISREIARLLPDSVRISMGEAALRSLTGDKRTCETPDGRRALDALTARLATASGSTAKFKVSVVDWKLLNAFAVPGEQIVLTRDLIEKVDSADEVAGVLAHEMGHGIELHPEANLVRALGLSATFELVMGGGTSGSTIANFGLLLLQFNYSRADERAADDHALRILRAARIAPRGLGNFMRRIQQIETGKSKTSVAREKTWVVDILSTHPQTAERAATIDRQEAYEATPALNPAEWQALRDLCRNSEKKGSEDDSEKGKGGAVSGEK